MDANSLAAQRLRRVLPPQSLPPPAIAQIPREYKGGIQSLSDSLGRNEHPRYGAIESSLECLWFGGTHVDERLRDLVLHAALRGWYSCMGASQLGGQQLCFMPPFFWLLFDRSFADEHGRKLLPLLLDGLSIFADGIRVGEARIGLSLILTLGYGYSCASSIAARFANLSRSSALGLWLADSLVPRGLLSENGRASTFPWLIPEAPQNNLRWSAASLNALRGCLTVPNLAQLVRRAPDQTGESGFMRDWLLSELEAERVVVEDRIVGLIDELGLPSNDSQRRFWWDELR